MNLHDTTRTLHRGPQPADAKGALILLHGRGADAEDIIGLADHLPVQDFAVYAPWATQNSWYPQRFFVPLEENEPWLSNAIGLVESLVAEIHAAGIPYGKIGIAGFSQGGCLALEYAMRHPRPYGLVAGMSSALVGPPKLERAAADLGGVPVLIACATHDAHIPLPLVEESIGTLRATGADLTSQIFRGYDHTIFPQEIDWLSARLAGWS